MIFGIAGHHITARMQASADSDAADAGNYLAGQFGVENDSNDSLGIVHTREATAALLVTGVPALDAALSIHQRQESDSFVVVHGNVFNKSELLSQYLDSEEITDSTDTAEIILALYDHLGTRTFGLLNGGFALALWDAPQRKFFLVRDHLGIEPLYYAFDDATLSFSSRLKSLTQAAPSGKQLNYGVLHRYLLFNYNPGYESFFDGIAAVRPGCYLQLYNGKLTCEQYWRPDFSAPVQKSETEYKRELLALMHDAVKLRLSGFAFRPGAFLSGGMDSSSVVHFMRKSYQQQFSTFSFRCRGKSYDESYYARIMSQRYHTTHHQVEYAAQDAHDMIAAIAAAQQEPFSDIGIEVASFLLGARVREHADFVLTGDGGDELFGGHPVYLADRVAQKFDRLPSWVRDPLTGALQLLPDTGSKKGLIVKAKRFSYSCNFPAALHSNRWRMYYTAQELKQLCTASVFEAVNGFDPSLQLRDIYREADGADALSRTLYGDYYSVVGFYLRRMELIREFGVEGRLPLLDYRLVDYAARIPSEWKISKNGDTKVLLHKVMTGELPDEIVFRTDKLGHSVPMKNWMREDRVVRELFYEYLGDDAIKRRGLFDANYVRQLKNEHHSRAHNHSHRLWALLMLELWCRAHLDG